MAFHPEDRVAHTSTDIGTGNLAVSSTPPAGYVTMTTAGYVAGDTFDAVIVASDGSAWECSVCQMVDATHIARNSVHSNSLGTTAFINFTSISKTVFVTYPAARYKTLVTGPASSTANDLASYSDATGKVIADSGIPQAQVARKDQPFGASGTGHAAGVVPDPGATAGTTHYLREDATWAIPAGGGGGSVTSVALTVPADETVTGSPITTSGTLAITRNAQSGNVFLASPLSGSSAAPAYRTIGAADLPVFVASGASHAKGAVPDPGATAGMTHYLREDASWTVPPVGITSITASAPLTGGTITTTGTLGVSVFVASGSSHASGIVPDPGATAGTARYLREDATWVVPPGTGVTSITASAPLTGGVITSTGTIGISVFGGSGSTHATGAVPDPGATAGTTRYLREDATWATPAGAGSVTSVAMTVPADLTVAGSPITTSGTLAVTRNAQSGNVFLASPLSGASAAPTYRVIGAADLPVFVASGSTHAKGAVPDPGATAGTTHYLREDATWVVPPVGITSITASAPLTGGTITTTGTIGISVFGASGASHAIGAVPDPGATAGATHFLCENATWAVPAGTGVTSITASAPLTGGTITTTGTIGISVFIASGASHASGIVPDPGATAGTTHYLREDATWQVPPIGVTSITASAPLTGGVITTTGTIGIAVFVASGASHAAGAVPDPGATAGTTRYLREDATWVAPPGGGGTVTSITASAPLTGGTITTTGTIGISVFVASGASHATGAVPDPGATAGTARFLCENATWATVPGIGTPGITDIYVDTTNGTDAAGQGGSAGAGAYKTIQYAVNQLPKLLLNSVTVHIAAGIYREQVTVQGIFFAGPYNLTFLGVNGTDVLASTSGATWTNAVANGQNGWTAITKTGATWTLNAFQGKLLTITSGTGAGQTFVVHSNTATIIYLLGRVGSSYLGGTLGDTSSFFHVYNWGTRVTGSNAAADTTPVRNYCFQITGVAGVVLNNLQLDYAALTCADVVRSLVDFQQCLLANSAHYGTHFNSMSAAVTGIVTCVFSTNHDFDILVEGASSVPWMQRTRVVSAATRCLQVTGLSMIHIGIVECYFNTTGGLQMYIADGASITIGDYTYVDGTGAAAGNHGIMLDTGARVNFSMITNATAVVANCTGWGLIATAGAQGANVAAQVSSWSSNVSGNYTPTTSLAGGNT